MNHLLVAGRLDNYHFHICVARRWMAAIRHAGRPTQTFISTAIYRQVRDLIGLAPEPPAQPVPASFIEARDWLDSLD